MGNEPLQPSCVAFTDERALAGFQLSLCRDAHAYREVLELRRSANAAIDQRASGTQPEDWGDEWDARSETLMVRAATNDLAASIRVTANGPGDSWKYEPYFATLSASERARSAESSRLCVHPAYRGLGLSYAVVAWTFSQAWRTAKSRLVGCCSPKLLPFWARWGFRPVATLCMPPDRRTRFEPHPIIVAAIGDAPPRLLGIDASLQQILDRAWQIERNL